MQESFREVLHDQGRGVIGALLLGTPLLFTMETWWLGGTLPAEVLLLFAGVGLIVTLVVLRVGGFRKSDEDSGPTTNVVTLAIDFAGIVIQSVVAAYVVLFTFGILDLDSQPLDFARIGLIELVPLGLGAAAANSILSSEGTKQAARSPFPKDVAVFAAGALFFALPHAPTDEMGLMAAHGSWWNLLGVMAISLVIVYMALYELEFRGQMARVKHPKRVQVGQTFLVFVVGLMVAFLLLAGFGQFHGVPHEVWVQKTIVLGFPAAMGGATAQVVL